MATNTYVALATQTLGSAAASVTFSSIPQGYTDLVVVAQVKGATATGDLVYRFNGDTGSNYSRTALYGTGSAAGSARSSSTTYISDYYGYPTTAANATDIIHLMNYSNTTTNKTVLARNNGPDGTEAIVGLWRSTAAITSIEFFITSSASNIATGSTFTIYGIAAQAIGTAKATGGTITYDAYGYVYHTFTGNGTFTPSQSLSCDYLVVAGGGGGGSYAGGGGGAGGYRAGTGLSVSTATTVTIGAGGTPGTYAAGLPGASSTFSSITSAGGGYGAGFSFGNPGGNGGSGGGASGANGNTAAGGTATPSGQGSNGGGVSSGGVSAAAGGGGAGAVGGSVTGSVGGAGGAGLNTLSSWATTTGTGVSGYYAGGGGGGADTAGGQTVGAGGAGGGGTGGVTAPASGAANTGGGGGGVWNPSYAGGTGGSGIVIIRYSGV